MSPRKPTRAAALGVSDDDYARMLAAQDGHCALCPSTPKTRRFSVDHDHATGAVRGLLCHRCNRALPTWITADWLHRAAAYLDNSTAGLPEWGTHAALLMGISHPDWPWHTPETRAEYEYPTGRWWRDNTPQPRTATLPQQATTGRGLTTEG